MKGNNIACKVVLVGNAGVGKTCIIQRYINGTYDPGNDESTITSSYSYKKVDFPEYKKSIAFDIWDTAGQELYRALAKNFYLNASIGVLVYDISRKESFEELKDFWYKELKNSGEENMVFAVVGNKSDLFSKEEVKEEEGKKYAKSINAIFKLTSCAENIGIVELFNECGIKYLESNKNSNKDKKPDKIVLEKKEVASYNNNIQNNKKKKKCC